MYELLSSFLFIGIVLGVKHAFEPDHVLTISQFTQKETNFIKVIGLSIFWSIGHSTILFVIAIVYFALGIELPEFVMKIAESLIGLILIFLGGFALFKLYYKKIHIHSHKHDSEKNHFHLHGHKNSEEHKHQHIKKSLLRLLLIGCIHGLAGSGAFIGLSIIINTTDFTSLILKLTLFAIGTTIGMSLFGAFFYFLLNRIKDKSNFIFKILTLITNILCCAYGVFLLVISVI